MTIIGRHWRAWCARASRAGWRIARSGRYADSARQAAVNGLLLADLLWRWHAGRAFVELVGARPGEVPSGHSLRRCRGAVEHVSSVGAFYATRVAPVCWKRVIGFLQAVRGQSDTAGWVTIRRWPMKASFCARMKDDGRALIASAALIKLACDA